MNLGSKTAAEQAARVVRKVSKYMDPENLEGGEVVDGWTCLGAGSYRSVWTKDGKVAYKVAHEEPEENHAEHLVYLDWHDLMPEGMRIPRMCMYGDVIAVEVVKGGRNGWEVEMPIQHRTFVQNTMELYDVEGYNYLTFEDGTTVLLDIAY